MKRELIYMAESEMQSQSAFCGEPMPSKIKPKVFKVSGRAEIGGT
jgi:hypothetical protein